MSSNIERAANTAAAISTPSWLVSLAANALPIVQLCAGLVAIVAGVFAIVVHWRKLKSKT